MAPVTASKAPIRGTKNASVDADFEIPIDDEETSAPKKPTKSAPKNTKAPLKKRELLQSAATAVAQAKPARSQRAAASKASQLLKGADATDDDAEQDYGGLDLPAPKIVAPKPKERLVSGLKRNTKSLGDLPSQSAKFEDDLDQNSEDLYTATPKQAATQKPALPKNKDRPTKRNTKSTGDIASKLNRILENVDDPIETSSYPLRQAKEAPTSPVAEEGAGEGIIVDLLSMRADEEESSAKRKATPSPEKL